MTGLSRGARLCSSAGRQTSLDFSSPSLIRLRDIPWLLFLLAVMLLAVLLLAAVLIGGWRDVATSLVSGAAAAVAVFVAVGLVSYRREAELAKQTLTETGRYAEYAVHRLRDGSIDDTPRDRCDDVRWDIVELRRLAEQAELIRLGTRDDLRRLKGVAKQVGGKDGVDTKYRHWRGHVVVKDDEAPSREEFEVTLRRLIDITGVKPRFDGGFRIESDDVSSEPAEDNIDAVSDMSADSWSVDGALNALGMGRIALVVDLESGEVHAARHHFEAVERLTGAEITTMSGTPPRLCMAVGQVADFQILGYRPSGHADEARAAEILRSWLHLE